MLHAKYILPLMIFVLLLSGCNKYTEKTTVFTETQNETVSFDLDSKVPVGNPDAPNTLVVFQDFECERCKEFQTEVMKDLEKDIKDGEVRVYYYNLAFVNTTSYAKALMSIYFEENHPAYYDQYLRAMYKLSKEDSTKLEDAEFATKKMKALFPRLKIDKLVHAVYVENEKLVKSQEDVERIAMSKKVGMVPAVFVNGKKIENVFYIDDIRSQYKDNAK